MMKTIKIFSLFVLIILITQTLTAQKNFAFDLRGGVNVATEDFGDADLNTGCGLDVQFMYLPVSHFGVFAGWTYNNTDTDRTFVGNNVEYEENGFMGGIEFNYPVFTPEIGLFIRGGALYNKLEVNDADGDLLRETDHEWGWQTAAGVDVKLGDMLHILPTVKFNSLTTEMLDESGMNDANLRYLSYGLGVRMMF